MKNSIVVFIFILTNTFINAQNLKINTSTINDKYNYEDINGALNGDCSLACAISWTISTSSELSPQDTIAYDSKSMEDGDRSTAWIEGKIGYGIGEKIIIKFTENGNVNNVPFSGIGITNGYAKSKDSWKNNSRIKLLKLYHNNISMFLIKLKDSEYPQRTNWGRDFLISNGDIVELEIIEVFEGKKWKDTAISDLVLYGAH